MQTENARVSTEVEEVCGVPVLKVSGEIDLYSAPQFKEAVASLIDSGTAHLIIDMSRVTYMDSGGFGTLLGALRRVRPEGGSIGLVQCSEGIARILQITRLDTVLGLFSDVEEAIKNPVTQ